MSPHAEPSSVSRGLKIINVFDILGVSVLVPWVAKSRNNSIDAFLDWIFLPVTYRSNLAHEDNTHSLLARTVVLRLSPAVGSTDKLTTIPVHYVVVDSSDRRFNMSATTRPHYKTLARLVEPVSLASHIASVWTLEESAPICYQAKMPTSSVVRRKFDS
jgi:hypothetical protein